MRSTFSPLVSCALSSQLQKLQAELGNWRSADDNSAVRDASDALLSACRGFADALNRLEERNAALAAAAAEEQGKMEEGKMEEEKEECGGEDAADAAGDEAKAKKTPPTAVLAANASRELLEDTYQQLKAFVRRWGG